MTRFGEGVRPAQFDRPPIRAVRMTETAAEEAYPRAQSSCLWLAIFLPRLPLSSLIPASSPPGQLQAVFEEAGRETRIVTVSARAAACGVSPGMTLNGALALVPALRLMARRPALEAATLERLAGWAGRFTPAVSHDGGNSLLLEVGASLKLFGGLGRLKDLLRQGLRLQGHDVCIACTPTPRAALWFARSGQQCTLRSAAALHQALAGVTVTAPGWPAKVLQLLLKMGLTTLGDCVRLPRQGFARRFGPGILRELDQAYGRAADPRCPFRSAERFEQALELPAETADAGMVLEGFQRLFRQLDAELASRQASVRSVGCRLLHPDGQQTRLLLALQQAAGVRLLPDLLRLRLASRALSAMVSTLVLEAELVPGREPGGTDLLGQALTPGSEMAGLLARLRARLGADAVQGLALVPEHRPERAWRFLPDPLATRAMPDSLPPGGHGPAHRERPVWLLPTAEPLAEVSGHPVWRGALRLERGPERIETGWWDGGDIRRDYYLASNRGGALLWIYRDLRSRAWYLHGIFG